MQQFCIAGRFIPKLHPLGQVMYNYDKVVIQALVLFIAFHLICHNGCHSVRTEVSCFKVPRDISGLNSSAAEKRKD